MNVETRPAFVKKKSGTGGGHLVLNAGKLNKPTSNNLNQ
jgi:hypothetical protein